MNFFVNLQIGRTWYSGKIMTRKKGLAGPKVGRQKTHLPIRQLKLYQNSGKDFNLSLTKQPTTVRLACVAVRFKISICAQICERSINQIKI